LVAPPPALGLGGFAGSARPKQILAAWRRAARSSWRRVAWSSWRRTARIRRRVTTFMNRERGYGGSENERKKTESREVRVTVAVRKKKERNKMIRSSFCGAEQVIS
jgi:hypothetical protein